MPAGRPKIIKGLKPKHRLRIVNKTRMLFDLEGATWGEFAEATELSRRTIQMLFEDIEGRSLGTLKKIAEVLGVQVRDLFDEIVEPVSGEEKSAAGVAASRKSKSALEKDQ